MKLKGAPSSVKQINIEKDEEYNCIECDYQFNNKMSLQKHINLIHTVIKETNGTIKCFKCEQKFSDHWTIMSHRKDNHLEQTNPCQSSNDHSCRFPDETQAK